MPYPTLTERKRAKVAQMTASVEILARELGRYAGEHGGEFVLFGSAARGELRYDSDVDVLVDFPEAAVDQAIRFAEERARALGLELDLRPMSWAGARLRERIAREGRPLS